MTALSVPAPMMPRGYMLMIHVQCFLDDSGKDSQQGNPYVCMAGYFGSDAAIVELNQKWGQLLMKHGINEVHMKYLIPIERQYKDLGWDVRQRDAVVDEFIGVIRETRLIGIGIALDIAAWRVAKKRHPKHNWGSAQQFCLERILRRIVDRLHVIDDETKIALIFDTDPEFSSNRINIFNALMGHDPRATKRLSSVTFAHPIYYPGLQCADLLVWETRKEMVQRAGGHASTKRWQALFAQMPDYRLEYIGEQWDEEEFQRASAEMLNMPAYEVAAASAGWAAARKRP